MTDLLFLFFRLFLLFASQFADKLLEEVLAIAQLVHSTVALVLAVLRREIVKRRPETRQTR